MPGLLLSGENIKVLKKTGINSDTLKYRGPENFEYE